MNTQVVTITLNPALDVTMWTDGLSTDRANTVLDEQVQAGGKGVNVARVTRDFGVPTRCVLLAGARNAASFYDALEDMPCEYREIDGVIRENITVRYGNETVKINRQGPTVPSDVCAQLPAWLSSFCDTHTIAVVAGSLPRGITAVQCADILCALKQAGAKVAVDTSALKLDDYARVSPWLMKPNVYELSALADQPCDTPEQTLAVARRVRAVTGVTHLLVSLGSDGLLYCGDGGEYAVTSPAVAVKSTVGAGDSLLGGFISAASENLSLTDSLARAVACGTDCVRRDGTQLATAHTMQDLLSRICIKEISDR